MDGVWGHMNFGIIGYGKMGQLRDKVLSSFSSVNVTHIFDIQKSPDRRFVLSCDEIIKNSEIDAVVIATPNCFISKLVVQALDNGKHVFAEKPPGVSSLEVKDMINAEQRNPNYILKFGFNHRCHDSVILAKERIDSGEFGKVLWMRGRYGKSVDENYKNDWRSSKELAGGGILLDQGIHMLDLLMMFGGGFSDVKSYCSNLYWDYDTEDNVFAMLKNEEGVVASLHSTMTQWRHLFSLEMFLERGYIVINGLLTSSGSYTVEDGKEVLTIAQKRTKPPQAKHPEEERYCFSIDNSWKRELEEFIHCIEHKKPVKVGNSADALELMKLLEKIYEDGK